MDIYLDAEFSQLDRIKALLPNGWFEHDREGNPLFMLDFGKAELRKLLKSVGSDILRKYFFAEIEHTWRMKF